MPQKPHRLREPLGRAKKGRPHRYWPCAEVRARNVTDSALLPPAIRQSNSLHKRVRLYASLCDSASFDPEHQGEFERLALDIARFQQEYSPGFARMVAIFGGRLDSLSDLPIVPSDAFRLTRVAAHPAELDQAMFRTSGTTLAMTGTHAVRDLATKEELALLQAKRTLFRDHGRGVVVALAPSPTNPHSSSLTHMMELFMDHFDGRPLVTEPDGASYSARAPGRWLFHSQGVDLEGLRRAARLAKHRSEPLYVLATSFALLATIEALDGERLETPARTVIMLTGGFKGHKTELNEAGLRRAAAETFDTDLASIWGEYGMTELSSQLFEQHPFKITAPLPPSATLGWWQKTAGPGTYFPPPWLKVRPIDPVNYRPCSPGQTGLAHFIDLANVDSCISVVTQDLIREAEGGIQLLGRAVRAPSRGCSLPFEGFLNPGSNHEVKSRA